MSSITIRLNDKELEMLNWLVKTYGAITKEQRDRQPDLLRKIKNAQKNLK